MLVVHRVIHSTCKHTVQKPTIFGDSCKESEMHHAENLCTIHIRDTVYISSVTIRVRGDGNCVGDDQSKVRRNFQLFVFKSVSEETSPLR